MAGTATRSGDDGDEDVEDAEEDAVSQLSSHSNDEHLSLSTRSRPVEPNRTDGRLTLNSTPCHPPRSRENRAHEVKVTGRSRSREGGVGTWYTMDSTLTFL